MLNEFFAEYPQLFDWREPDGSCVAFVRYKGADGVETFTRQLVGGSRRPAPALERLPLRTGAGPCGPLPHWLWPSVDGHRSLGDARLVDSACLMTEPLPLYTKCPGSSLFGSWQHFMSFLETT